jgi:hypothetical protein
LLLFKNSWMKNFHRSKRRNGETEVKEQKSVAVPAPFLNLRGNDCSTDSGTPQMGEDEEAPDFDGCGKIFTAKAQWSPRDAKPGR